MQKHSPEDDAGGESPSPIALTDRVFPYTPIVRRLYRRLTPFTMAGEVPVPLGDLREDEADAIFEASLQHDIVEERRMVAIESDDLLPRERITDPLEESQLSHLQHRSLMTLQMTAFITLGIVSGLYPDPKGPGFPPSVVKSLRTARRAVALSSLCQQALADWLKQIEQSIAEFHRVLILTDPETPSPSFHIVGTGATPRELLCEAYSASATRAMHAGLPSALALRVLPEFVPILDLLTRVSRAQQETVAELMQTLGPTLNGRDC